jgi:hypothetical protein
MGEMYVIPHWYLWEFFTNLSEMKCQNRASNGILIPYLLDTANPCMMLLLSIPRKHAVNQICINQIPFFYKWWSRNQLLSSILTDVFSWLASANLTESVLCHLVQLVILHAGCELDNIVVASIFSLCPDRLWGPPSLLYNGYQGSLPRG